MVEENTDSNQPISTKEEVEEDKKKERESTTEYRYAKRDEETEGGE